MLYSWVKYIGALAEYVDDIDTADIQQHIDVTQSEVVFLPFETCAFLLVNEPSNWTAQTVVPGTIPTTHDAPTGLDYIDVTAGNPWGLSATTGLPYFDGDGLLADNERARLIYTGGSVFLTQ